MAAEPKWQQNFSSEHPDEWTDEDEVEWQEANASRLAPDDRQLGQILGVVSIGLGLAELLAPRAVGRAIGVGDHPAIMRMVGVREIVTGLGILSERAPGSVGVGARRRRCDGPRAARRSHELARCRSATHRRRHSRCARRRRARRLLRSTLDCVAIHGSGDLRDADDHHQFTARRAVRLLEERREPAAVHGAPGVGVAGQRSRLALGREGARRHDASSGMRRSSTISRSGGSAGARCRARKSRTKAW